MSNDETFCILLIFRHLVIVSYCNKLKNNIWCWLLENRIQYITFHNQYFDLLSSESLVYEHYMERKKMDMVGGFLWVHQVSSTNKPDLYVLETGDRFASTQKYSTLS